ncbi:hypothetical protein [Streptomyces sp. NPDC087437]|uniref:hypothetical protein n=1 Tax=Streptomyces sp. NPDC087437 TaxID=3365789 RepID=UPI0037F4374D
MIASICIGVAVMVTAGALVLLLGRASYSLVARDLARYLREQADQLESRNVFRPEPPGMRHAADLIDPRTRRRRR